jgi:hypothetical protein
MAPDQDDDTGLPAQEAVRLRLHAQVECLLPAAPGGRRLCVPDDANTGVIAHRMPRHSVADPSLGHPAPTVTVNVTAVTGLLTPLGWDTSPQATRREVPADTKEITLCP